MTMRMIPPTMGRMVTRRMLGPLSSSGGDTLTEVCGVTRQKLVTESYRLPHPSVVVGGVFWEEEAIQNGCLCISLKCVGSLLILHTHTSEYNC